MKPHLFICSFILLFALLTIPKAWSQEGFDRVAYYTTFAKNDAADIEVQLKKVALLTGTDKQAFEGALLMRKAGLQSGLMQKLSIFKQGGKALEAAIKAKPQNAEYRFLRLMIQENAPKIVGYDSELKADSDLVKSKQQSLPAATRKAVLDYAKVSKYL